MLRSKELITYLDNLLNSNSYQDYQPNGLQVEGQHEVRKIISGVTACQELIDEAVAYKADTILVHHGFFWKGEDNPIVGVKKRRLETLLNNNINLIAYHLPLDFHSELGNNVQFARQLKINITGDYQGYMIGEFKAPMSPADLTSLIEKNLQRKPLHITTKKSQIKTIAWAVGAAQDYIEEFYI